MNPFDSYMLNKVRRLKDVRTRYAATGEKAVLAGVPEEDREFVIFRGPGTTDIVGSDIVDNLNEPI